MVCPTTSAVIEPAREELSRIEADAAAFLASMEDPRRLRVLPLLFPRFGAAKCLPSFKRWMWDGEFCGSIGFRWQPGTTALPPALPGAYRLCGRAVEAAPRVCKVQRYASYSRKPRQSACPTWRSPPIPDNIASQRVIEANGGILVETFREDLRNSAASLGCAFVSFYMKAPNPSLEPTPKVLASKHAGRCAKNLKDNHGG